MSENKPELAILVLVIFALISNQIFVMVGKVNLLQYLMNRVQEVPPTPEEELAVIVYFAILIILVGGSLIFYQKYRHKIETYLEQRRIKKRFSSSQGTAQWATVDHFNKLAGKDGVVVGYNPNRLGVKEVRLSMAASCEHLAIIGPTGCGKTTKFFIPNILTVPPNTSMVITDPKGELESLTAPILRERGWEVYTFSIMNPTHSYNPLAIAREATEIFELANIMLENGYSSGGPAGDTQWVNFALPLWEAALFAEIFLAQKENRLPSVEKAYEFITEKSADEQIEIVAEEGDYAYRSYLTFMQAAQAPETVSSIKMVASTSLKLFTRPDITQAMSGNRIFSPKMLRDRPTAYFVQIPEHKSNLIKPITATLYWQLMEHLIETPGLPIIFFMDEFANIGKIPGFAQMAATLRSRKISLNVCLQGIEQLSREYSREEQTDIINNLKTKIYFPASTGEAGAQFTEVVGRATHKEGENLQSVSLMSADELRRIPDDHIIVLAHNLNPIMLKTVPWYKNRAFSKVGN